MAMDWNAIAEKPVEEALRLRRALIHAAIKAAAHRTPEAVDRYKALAIEARMAAEEVRRRLVDDDRVGH